MLLGKNSPPYFPGVKAENISCFRIKIRTNCPCLQRIWLSKNNSTRMRFELTRAEPNRLAVCRLNHSATLSCLQAILFKISPKLSQVLLKCMQLHSHSTSLSLSNVLWSMRPVKLYIYSVHIRFFSELFFWILTPRAQKLICVYQQESWVFTSHGTLIIFSKMLYIFSLTNFVFLSMVQNTFPTLF